MNPSLSVVGSYFLAAICAVPLPSQVDRTGESDQAAFSSALKAEFGDPARFAVADCRRQANEILAACADYVPSGPSDWQHLRAGLTLASEFAARATDAELLIRTSRSIADRFDLEPLRCEIDSLCKALAHGSPEDRRDVVVALLDASQRALDAARVADAGCVLDALSKEVGHLRKGLPAAAEAMAQQRSELRWLEKLRDTREACAAKDPSGLGADECLDLGIALVVFDRDWRAACGLFARCEKEPWRTAARCEEGVQAAGPSHQLRTACQGWLEIARREVERRGTLARSILTHVRELSSDVNELVRGRLDEELSSLEQSLEDRRRAAATALEMETYVLPEEGRWIGVARGSAVTRSVVATVRRVDPGRLEVTTRVGGTERNPDFVWRWVFVPYGGCKLRLAEFEVVQDHPKSKGLYRFDEVESAGECSCVDGRLRFGFRVSHPVRDPWVLHFDLTRAER